MEDGGDTFHGGLLLMFSGAVVTAVTLATWVILVVGEPASYVFTSIWFLPWFLGTLGAGALGVGIVLLVSDSEQELAGYVRTIAWTSVFFALLNFGTATVPTHFRTRVRSRVYFATSESRMTSLLEVFEAIGFSWPHIQMIFAGTAVGLVGVFVVKNNVVNRQDSRIWSLLGLLMAGSAFIASFDSRWLVSSYMASMLLYGWTILIGYKICRQNDNLFRRSSQG